MLHRNGGEHNRKLLIHSLKKMTYSLFFKNLWKKVISQPDTTTTERKKKERSKSHKTYQNLPVSFVRLT